MQPQAPNDNQNDRSLNIPNRNDSAGSSLPQRGAAANIMRDRINQIYETAPPNQPASTASAPQSANPYQRTHDPSKSAAAWQQYHTAWQNYYKQYYERYYINQLNSQRQAMEAEKAKNEARRNFEASTAAPKTVVSSHAAAPKRRFGRTNESTGSAAKDQEAPNNAIKNELLEKIQEQAGRFRRSHHFVPIVSAVVVGALFLGLQYNRVFVAQVMAYVSPGSASAQSIIIDPTLDTKVSQDPRIIIPKINVDAPVVYGLTSLKEEDVQMALREGVVHYPYPGASSVPGQVGNSVMLGHTSNDVFDPGKYKFVFTLIERLEKGDTIYMNYQGTRYTYIINKMEVVNPNQIDKLVVKTDKPLVTLVGCVPIGTADKRLLVTAEQVSPDPSKAAPQSADSGTQEQTDIPSFRAPTAIEQLFGN